MFILKPPMAPTSTPSDSQEASKKQSEGFQEVLKKHEWPVTAALHSKKRLEASMITKPL